MRFLIIFALAFALHAEDQKPTVEQLQAQLTAKDQQIAQMQRYLGYWTQSAITCEAAPRVQQINAQIDQQAKQQQPAQPPRPAKPEPPKQGDGK